MSVAGITQSPPPACCSVAPCRDAVAQNETIERAPPGTARHPLPYGELEPLSASWPTSHTETRPRSALVAPVAAPLVADGDSVLPQRFDGRFRNPCWQCNGSSARHNQLTSVATLCCLPYAHIIGVSKCGTTDLYTRLANHDHVLRSANKGPHFWDEDHSFGWYVDLYSRNAARLLRGSRAADAIFVDASSNTLTYTGVGVRGKRKLAAPVAIPQVLRWLQPSARVLLMLREPGARYFSAYGYYNLRYRVYRRYGPHGAASFGRMVDTEVDAFTRCRDEGATARRCARGLFGVAEQLIKGLYAVFLGDWVGAFPRERLLVIRLEDYTERLAEHMAAVFRFLALPTPPAALWRRMIAQRPANRRAPGGEAMLESTRTKLLAFYADYNAQLAAMLGDASYLKWNERQVE